MSKFFHFIFCIILSYSSVLVAMDIQEEQNHYEVLGVERTATRAEIARAYRDLARQLHPDRNNNPDATQISQRINAAYNVIGNEQNKQRYDRKFCILCDRRIAQELRASCGHGLCMRHAYIEYLRLRNNNSRLYNCAACQNNHVTTSIEIPDEVFEMFRNHEQTMANDRENYHHYRDRELLPVRYSNICIMCQTPTLQRSERVNLPTCGHCFCIPCAQERFVNQRDRYCNIGCRANFIGMTDEQLAEVEQYIHSYKNFQKIKIALGVTAAVGVVTWLSYEWFQAKKAKKARDEKKKKEELEALKKRYAARYRI